MVDMLVVLPLWVPEVSLPRASLLGSDPYFWQHPSWVSQRLLMLHSFLLGLTFFL